MRGGHLTENDWSYRLHQCLKLCNINTEFTAEYGSDHKKYWRHRLPENLGEKCFLFRGSPDLITEKTTKHGEGTVIIEQNQVKNLESLTLPDNGSSDPQWDN